MFEKIGTKGQKTLAAMRVVFNCFCPLERICSIKIINSNRSIEAVMLSISGDPDAD